MVRLLCILLLLLSITACGGQGTPEVSHTPTMGLGEASPSAQPATQPKIDQEETALKITVEGREWLAAFEDHSSARAFQALLEQGPVTIGMQDYGGFEKVGELDTELVRNDTRITAVLGDIILYQGNQVTIYYGTNTWNFTRLAHIDDPTGLEETLGSGTVSVTFSLE